MTFITLLILYICFRFKHLFCDWFLQSKWMALNKGLAFKEGGYSALFAHAAIHGLGTLIITLIFASQLWWLCLIDFIIHAFVDRIKARSTIKYNLTPKDKWYWWSLGIDQELHHFTQLMLIVIIYILR